ncbi:MAG: type 4a pilus biogenesis protein PilO [Patescibacteria group bacterium]
MQKITTAITTLGLAVIVIFGVLWPAYKILNNLKGEISNINDAIAQKNQEMESLKFFSQRMKEMDPAQVNRINALAPAQSQPDLIAEVNGMALASGLSINTFSETPLETQTGGPLKQSRVEISFKSDYANLKRFLSNMELSARLFELSGLSLKAAGVELGKGQLPLDVKTNFDIYYK